MQNFRREGDSQTNQMTVHPIFRDTICLNKYKDFLDSKDP